MSKYPVTYYSESKRVEIAIEDMATPHLMNAWRKTVGDEPMPMVPAEEGDYRGKILISMNQELVSRGCTYDPETERWTIPAKEGA